MTRVLPVIAAVALAVYCLVECVQTDRRLVRYLPKLMWFFLILIPVIGPVAWLLAGRPRASRPGPRPGSGRGSRPTPPPRPAAPVAPDDDPAFLAQLDEQRRLDAWDSEARRRRETGDKDDDPESRRDSGS